MHIKTVKEYCESYCELVVSDKKKNVVCICDSVSLDNGLMPISGMAIKKLNAFFLDESPKITITNKHNYKLSKVGICGMSYSLRGKIVDAKRYIVKVFDFYVSLEYLFSSEYIGYQEFVYKEGEWVEFIADKFDAVI